LSRHQDPFEVYKARLARKLARRAEAQDSSNQPPPEKGKAQGDDINWFGVKVGTGDSAFVGGSADTGVGKYLSIKRPLDQGAQDIKDVGDDTKKKRKIGFGNFDSW